MIQLCWSRQIVVIVISTLRTAVMQRDLGSVSMDQSEDCQLGVQRPNNDVSEGDFFTVKSDSYSGKPSNVRQPAECLVTFNLGNRLLSVDINDWFCENPVFEPFLVFYEDCSGYKRNLLSLVNCSMVGPFEIFSTSSACISIYHFRGNRRGGYYFSLTLVVGEELLAFPAGVIAAVIFSVVVGLLVLIKLVCILTGYERRLPDTQLNLDGHTKQSLDARTSSTTNEVQSVAMPADSIVLADNRSIDGNGYIGGVAVNHSSLATSAHVGVNSLTRNQNPFKLSNNCTDRPNVKVTSDYDHSILDFPADLTPRRINQYSSIPATSIWQHQ